jgi:YXWGXW repeat-containing protein
MRMARVIGLLMIAFVMLTMPKTSSAQIAVGISVRVAPPPIPVYEQPICPGDGFMWTPGYWGYANGDYFWVPGTWVRAPFVGGLWTPGYWGWGGGAFFWHAGYWGPHIGFYGGVNYGFGYGGVGFFGGGWRGGVFAYNRSVTNVNVTVIHNTYNERVMNTNVSRTSFNGGAGGVVAQPNATERAAENEHHTAATGEQTEHEHTASTNKAQYAAANHGTPGVAASPKAGVMSGNGVVGAKGAAGANAGGNKSNAVNNGNNSPKNGGANAANGNNKGGGNGGKKNPPPPKKDKKNPPPKGGEKPKEHQ